MYSRVVPQVRWVLHHHWHQWHHQSQGVLGHQVLHHVPTEGRQGVTYTFTHDHASTFTQEQVATDWKDNRGVTYMCGI